MTIVDLYKKVFYVPVRYIISNNNSVSYYRQNNSHIFMMVRYIHDDDVVMGEWCLNNSINTTMIIEIRVPKNEILQYEYKPSMISKSNFKWSK